LAAIPVGIPVCIVANALSSHTVFGAVVRSFCENQNGEGNKGAKGFRWWNGGTPSIRIEVSLVVLPRQPVRMGFGVAVFF